MRSGVGRLFPGCRWLIPLCWHWSAQRRRFPCLQQAAAAAGAVRSCRLFQRIAVRGEPGATSGCLSVGRDGCCCFSKKLAQFASGHLTLVTF
ncbi:unnamed protein product [Gongylonema pulchrum]|uniref:Secreted protein n=1 Tax=Gongylonema pulchrum TaxID=637853 RepID=A0A183E0F1_9BILA|nr:unnamed protein product [Gongylonema pulchrum]